MKGVVVGADLMYRKDGSLAPIEINTNVGWDESNRAEEESEVFDITDLVAFINKHNIKKVYLEGNIGNRIYKQLFNAVGSSTEMKIVSLHDLEELKESDSILAIRTSYSDEALVDSFCRDKIAFLKSLEGSELACEYLLKTADGFEGNITSIEEDYPAGVPNFILKYRYPNYNKKEYPKLLRFESLEDLKDYAEDMPEDFFLMPYYYCEDKLYNGSRITVIREISIFVGNKEGSLDTIQVGKYTKVCDRLDSESVAYSEQGELDSKYREMFLSANWFSFARKEMALLDKGDLVWMSDGSWKKIEDLKEGEYVKSLEVPAKKGYNTNNHTGKYGVSVEQLEQETHYVDNEVQEIKSLNRFGTIVKFKFVDGSDWYDTDKSSYPVVNAEEEVEFKTLDTLEVGDRVILISLETSESPKFLVKEIAEIEKERKLLEEGYSLELKGSHLFISRTQGEEQAYASIEHNPTQTANCTFVVIWGYRGVPSEDEVPDLVMTSDSPDANTPTGIVASGQEEIHFINVSSQGQGNPSYIYLINDDASEEIASYEIGEGCPYLLIDGYKVADLTGGGKPWESQGRQLCYGTERGRAVLEESGIQSVHTRVVDPGSYSPTEYPSKGFAEYGSIQMVSYDVTMIKKS